MNNAVLGKTMENVRKHRNFKLVAANRTKNNLVSGPMYDRAKWLSKKSLALEMKKMKVKMSKPIYLGLSILEIIKHQYMNLVMTILNQSINIMQMYATSIQIPLSFILKLKMFIKTLQMMLKKDLTHQNM